MPRRRCGVWVAGLWGRMQVVALTDNYTPRMVSPMSIRIRVYPQASSPVVQARRRARRMRHRALQAQRRYLRFLHRQSLVQQSLGCPNPYRTGFSNYGSSVAQFPPPPPSAGYCGSFTGALNYQQLPQPYAAPYAGYQQSYGYQTPLRPWASPASSGFWGSLGNLFGGFGF